jgi:phosphatidylethanolamine-binding protein (PEBP) family uncharacterized protein
LDTSLELLPETGREGLETAMAGHILAEAKIEAVFMRK